MAARTGGSQGGRAVVDWDKAFALYASLPDPNRTYQAVADHYGISVRTVEKHGRLDGWKQRVREIKRVAAKEADLKLAENRAEKLAEIELLIEASLTTLANQLRNGQVKLSVSDLVRLCRLRDDLWAADDTATQRARSEANAAEAELEDPLERTREIARALHEAGAFDRLNQLLDPDTREAA